MLADLTLGESLAVAGIAAAAAVIGSASGLWIARRDRRSEERRAASRDELEERTIRRRMQVDLEIADRKYKVHTYERTLRYCINLRQNALAEAYHYRYGGDLSLVDIAPDEPATVSARMRLHGGDTPRTCWEVLERTVAAFDQLVLVLMVDRDTREEGEPEPDDVRKTRDEMSSKAIEISKQVDDLLTQMRGDLTLQATTLGNPIFAT